MKRVTVYVQVDSAELLHEAAFDRLRNDNVAIKDALQTLGTPDDINVNACLIMLLDPGHLTGCTIHESTVED